MSTIERGVHKRKLANESLLVYDRQSVRGDRGPPCRGGDRPVACIRQCRHHRRIECRAGRVGVAAGAHTPMSGGPVISLMLAVPDAPTAVDWYERAMGASSTSGASIPWTHRSSPLGLGD